MINEKKSVLRDSFGAAAAGGVRATQTEPRKKNDRPVYVSLRVTPEEKARLQRDAAGLSISAYVRDRLFGAAVCSRMTKGKFPVKDHEALAKVLRALGRSGTAQNYQLLSLAVADGTLILDEESNLALRQVCADIAAIRRDLITALGLKAGP